MGMSFEELEALRREVATVKESHVKSLLHYTTPAGGFWHKYDEKSRPGKKFSAASTATCVISLTSTDRWTKRQEWKDKTASLARDLLDSPWKSAGLEENNPFTVGFMLECVTALEMLDNSLISDATHQKKLAHAETILNEALKRGEGAAPLNQYPPSSYLTQLVVRVLNKRKKLEESLR